MTNLIKKEEREDRIEKYSKALPKMLKERGVQHPIKILDAGEENWEAFREIVIEMAIQKRQYTNELIENLANGENCMNNNRIQEYISTEVQEQNAKMDEKRQIEAMFADMRQNLN